MCPTAAQNSLVVTSSASAENISEGGGKWRLEIAFVRASSSNRTSVVATPSHGIG